MMNILVFMNKEVIGMIFFRESGWEDMYIVLHSVLFCKTL